MTHTITPDDLSLVAKLSRRKLDADEIYTFSVRLCDNEIDRDGERFSDETLAQLAPMFVGKSGIFDHEWSAKNQTARIYKTEVITEPDCTTSDGFVSRWLKGHAYMLREGNPSLIAEIEAGIKREVSVGCSVDKRLCSICGGDGDGCGHQRGKTYDGAVCHTVLHGAKDAYEWSFVAVPAQKSSGVTKSKREKKKEGDIQMTLKELAATGGKNAEVEYKQLCDDAEYGRETLRTLRKETARLATAVTGLNQEVSTSLADKLSPSELAAFKGSLEGLAASISAQPQLRGDVSDRGRNTPYSL